MSPFHLNLWTRHLTGQRGGVYQPPRHGRHRVRRLSPQDAFLARDLIATKEGHAR
jgi:hypothetical protein